MIKEISNFITSLDPEMKKLGIKPKEGLHILLKISEKDGKPYINKTFQSAYTGKQDLSHTELKQLKKCAALSQLSWYIDLNKCFDLPAKAIHTCSPYSIATKRENLTGGAKYKTNDKSQVYNRISDYFRTASELATTEKEIQYIKVYEKAINTESKFNGWLRKIPAYKFVKDNEYVIFYLDLPAKKYEKANTKYLQDKLFNTNKYNKQVEGILYGTSNFFNGYPIKKPFLTHQTASFDISNRISEQQAWDLYDFQDIMRRKILPKPLPIFIHQDEIRLRKNKTLQQSSIAIFKRDALIGVRRGYQEIIKELYEEYEEELGNYYLLFYDYEEIKDFDFVPKFEFLLKDNKGVPWEIKDLFTSTNAGKIKNVFQLEQAVLQPVFNNSLITRTKAGNYQFKYFDEIDPKYCKSDASYLLVTEYRRAFYDFIYKAKRQAVTAHMFNYILQTSILEDIRLDEIRNGYHTQNKSIKEKLNIWFSLTGNFVQSHKNNYTTMSNKLPIHQEFMKKLMRGEAHITSDDEYAFTAGQIIYYLLSKSVSGDRSHTRLEPFIQQVHANQLNKALVRLFESYKHVTFSSGFRAPFAEVLAYDTKKNIRDFTPIMLSGYFSKNNLYGSKDKAEQADTSSDETIEQ
jgi:CRISPR-associated protein Csh1